MKVPITLIIEQERRRRAEQSHNNQRIQIDLPLPLEAPRPSQSSHKDTVDFDIYSDESDASRGMTVINIFGDDDDVD